MFKNNQEFRWDVLVRHEEGGAWHIEEGALR